MTSPSDPVLQRLMALHPKVIDLTLDRIKRLLATLGHPELRLPRVVHIAGTNGKGSTTAMIRAGLEGAGYRVHVYTSPHLAEFRERIRLAGEVISEERLVDELERCEIANGGEPITYFEITTAAALLAMAETPADFTLLEVGLGGRLDATNVLDRPALTVITPVSVDHQQYLGESLAEIAAEKAGILKPGVSCVVAAQSDVPYGVIAERAETIGSELISNGVDWQIWEENGRMVFQDLSGLLDLPLPNLIGAHQVINAGAAIAALRYLGVDEKGCEMAVTTAEWPARLQKLRHGPLVDAAGLGAEIWLDGGHNPAAAEALAEALSRLPKRPVYLIAGMLRTKDSKGYFQHMSAVAMDLRAVSIPGEAATLTADETTESARSAGLKAHPCDSVLTAVKEIVFNDPNARILVCGSLYLAGSVLRDNG